ncbi:MAG: hypothetical protein MUO19_05140, partial [Dehalococcoidales bacterium]|nr:hypothetical protein [Dehalococcoidales bacterium]
MMRVVRAVIVAVVLFPFVVTGSAFADDTWTQTSQADYASGTLFQVDITTSPGDVTLEQAGSVRYTYALRGGGYTDFWQYDAVTDTWKDMADTPGTVKQGGSLAYDGATYIYAFRGNSTTFWRYDIGADSWSTLAAAPGKVKTGGALAYNSGYVYAMRGDDMDDFWRYNVTAGSWETLAGTDDDVNSGGALTTDGGNYVYAFQCIGTAVFWRYDISADTWTLMADTPNDVGNGAALAYDDAGSIYTLRGMDQDDFWHYDIPGDTWTAMADTPGTVEWGGSLAYNGDNYVYALRGDNTGYHWRYDIAGDTWSSLASASSSVNYGGALAIVGAPYHDSGTLESVTFDTGFPSEFGSLSWNATASSGTSVRFQLATNTDNATWSFRGPGGSTGTYYTGSGTDAWSGHDEDRFIRYKAFLDTTGGTKTPVLHDVSLVYALYVVLPSVTTGNATEVEETWAVLPGTVTDDGGEDCEYRFEYGITPGESYAFSTVWKGSLSTGQSFSENVSGLGKGTKYYYRAQVRNSSGTADGDEVSFLTKPDEPVTSTFKAEDITDTSLTLTWTKGEGAQRTMIRRKTGGFP